MRRSLPSIIGVGLLFLVIGVLDVARGLAPLFAGARRLAGDDVLVLTIGITALVGGANLLRGRDWARWLLAAWMALHVAISIKNPTELVMHLVIFGFVAFLLFRASASAYFGQRASG